jgi:hypothetical protein
VVDREWEAEQALNDALARETAAAAREMAAAEREAAARGQTGGPDDAPLLDGYRSPTRTSRARLYAPSWNEFGRDAAVMRFRNKFPYQLENFSNADIGRILEVSSRWRGPFVPLKLRTSDSELRVYSVRIKGFEMHAISRTVMENGRKKTYTQHITRLGDWGMSNMWVEDGSAPKQRIRKRDFTPASVFDRQGVYEYFQDLEVSEEDRNGNPVTRRAKAIFCSFPLPRYLPR